MCNTLPAPITGKEVSMSEFKVVLLHAAALWIAAELIRDTKERERKKILTEFSAAARRWTRKAAS